jgi:hypothetical protein
MSAIDTIKLGLEEDDINIVRQGFFELTGETVFAEEPGEVATVSVATKTVVATKKAPKKKKAAKRKKATRKKATRKKAAVKKAPAKSKGLGREGFLLEELEPNQEVGNARFTKNLFQSETGHAEPLSETEAKQLGQLIGHDGHKPAGMNAKYETVTMNCHRCRKDKAVNPSYIIPGARYFYCDTCLSKR